MPRSLSPEISAISRHAYRRNPPNDAIAMTRKRRSPPPGGGRLAAQRPDAGDNAAGFAAWPGHPTPDRLRRSDPPPAREGGADRIAKVMARAGLCSRRDAEEWIAAGRVAVNGSTISSPAVNVTARDRITVDGKRLPRRERTRLFLYHKPVGLVSTNADPQGRPTVFDALPKNLPRLMSIGRLDIGTEGLLLLTNDGGLARVLELPDTAWVRRYRVRAHGRVSQGELDGLRDGIAIGGVYYAAIEATLEREQGANVWLSFEIREGKNREVRNVLAHLGLKVNRLIRVEFGPFGLGHLAQGAIEEVETRNLREQLGARIIREAGCDFTKPIVERPADSPLSREQRREQRRALRDRLRPRENRRGERAAGQFDRDDHRPFRSSETRPDKRAGLLTDKKGRRILVERFGTQKEKPEAAQAPIRGRPPRRRPSPDRASGPRPSRPRFSKERSVEPRPAKPRKSDSRTDGLRKEGRGQPRPHLPRSRTPGPQPSGPRPPRNR